MCLITFKWNEHPKYKLILVANRDEFYHRPTLNADYWQEHPDVLAGRDQEANGTWLGINRNGRWTALTNYRDLTNLKSDAPSRGLLTAAYLKGTQSPNRFLHQLAPKADFYNGFNLLLGTFEELYYFSNYEHKIRQLMSGTYALSNALLDSDWYKVNRAKKALLNASKDDEIVAKDLIDLLQDVTLPKNEADIQQTGLSMEQERMLAPMFIKSPEYGTVSSAVLLIDYNRNVEFLEQRHEVGKNQAEESHFHFRLFGSN